MTDRATGAIVEPEVLDEHVDQLRKNIDAIDEAIIALAKERQQYSAGVRRLKRRQGKPGVDLSREAEIFERYAELGPWGHNVCAAILHHSKDVGPR